MLLQLELGSVSDANMSTLLGTEHCSWAEEGLAQRGNWRGAIVVLKWIMATISTFSVVRLQMNDSVLLITYLVV